MQRWVFWVMVVVLMDFLYSPLAQLAATAVMLVGLALLMLRHVRPNAQLQQQLHAAQHQRDDLLTSNAQLHTELRHAADTLAHAQHQLHTTSTQLARQEETTKQTEKHADQQRIKLQQDEQLLGGLRKELAQYKEAEHRHNAARTAELQRLSESNTTLQAEQQRVEHTEKERVQQQTQQRTREWAEHENTVVAALNHACSQPELQFTTYGNAALPPELDAAIKPDFMVQILGQYMVFDAKKSKDLPVYLREQVKSTAKKYAGNRLLYPVVFFVVPSGELTTLKQTTWVEGGYTFFAIAPEMVAPVLAAYKRLCNSEQLAQLDPTDRETLVQLIAGYDQHLAYRNAADVLLTQHSMELRQRQQQLTPAWQTEVQHRRQQLGRVRLSPSDIDRLSQDPQRLSSAVEQLLCPTAAVPQSVQNDTAQLLGGVDSGVEKE